MRVAAFQRFPIFDAIDQVGDVLLRDLLWGDEHGVDLALFPECYLQGHTYDQATAERRATSLNELSQHRLLSRLASIRTAAIIGFFERRGEAVYNSAMVVEGGRIKGVYAKAYPIEDGCAFGKDFPVWSCAEWTFGINICNDLNYPEAAEQITSKGANLICCPLNMMLRPKKAEKWREPALENLRACARRTKRWVASSDVTGHNYDGWLSYGCTAIIRPNGTIAARAAELVEDVVLFDLC